MNEDSCSMCLLLIEIYLHLRLNGKRKRKEDWRNRKINKKEERSFVIDVNPMGKDVYENN